MARLLWGVVAVLVALWFFFALVRAVGTFIHLALVVAVILVVLNLVNSLRNRARID